MAKKGFVTQLEKETEKNTDYRRVLYTGMNSQLVLMCLEPGVEIGEEVHPDRDQFFRFETGDGAVFIDKVRHNVRAGDGVIVPAGALHNVVNTSKKEKLRLYTIYSPPEHVDKTVRHTKADAEAQPEEYDGKPTE
jgi:mannose-6-phosphate isomerase-like protein (cupin superfamily)